MKPLINPDRHIKGPVHPVWGVILVGVFAAVAGLGRPSSATDSKDAEWLSLFSAPGETILVGESKAFLLLPEGGSESENRPWVWYAPTFIGRHPHQGNVWVFDQLLAQGFAVAGIDVGESYGSPAGTEIYSEFYRVLTDQYNLSEKPSLLPQSRGGLMLYNWASENPGRVQCIAGIFPVCNLASYPGLDRACGAYGLTEDEMSDRLEEFNPISRLAPTAQAGVPLFHVHGDSDKVVPLEDNSQILIDRYKALGGEAELVVVPGKGHEVVPEFFESQAMIDFILENSRK